jgi:hypothetical protein
MSWRRRASCRLAVLAGEAETDDWYPVGQDTGEKARDICDRCPVQQHCLHENLLEIYGIYAALDPTERRALVRALARQRKAAS